MSQGPPAEGTETSPPERRTAVGTVRTMMGVAYTTLICLVLGLYVPRALQPTNYALFAVTFSVINWVEISTRALLLSGLGKLLVDAEDKWRDLAGAALIMGLSVAGLASVALFLTAPFVARALGDDALTPFIRIFALDPPFSVAWQFYSSVCNTRRQYERRVIILWTYWTVRAAGTIGLIMLGYGVAGALCGAVAGSASAAVVGILLSGLGLPRYATSLKPLFAFNWPIGTANMARTLVNMSGIWFIKALSSSPGAAGVYAIAALMNGRLTPILASVNTAMQPKLIRSIRQNEHASTRELISESYRFTLIITIPLLAVFIPQATPLVVLLFSDKFVGAAIPGIILLSVLPLILMGLTAAGNLVAAHEPLKRLWAVVPAPIIGIPLYAWAVPKYGIVGAAATSASAASITAVLSLLLSWREFGVGIPLKSLLRSTFAGVITVLVGLWWSATGLELLGKCAILVVLYVALLALIGELKRRDIEPIVRAFRMPRISRRRAS